MVAPTIDQYLSRLCGIISPALRGKRVLAVGTGAGSYMLEKLARFGIGGIRLVDFDIVEWENLCRTVFGVRDIGTYKVEALKRRIQDANPYVEVEAMPLDICALSEREQRDLIDGYDIIVAGTDHFPAQALMNHWSQRTGIPAVWIGIHEQARGGRVVWSLPGETSCYREVAADRYEAFAEQGAEGTNLPGAHGALVDVQLIDMVALKMVLALLERGQDSALGRFFAGLGHRNEIIVRSSPDYAYGRVLWDAILSDLPTTPKDYAEELKSQILYAMDTVWLETAPDPKCPDCAEYGTWRIKTA